jgi:hypothetical protein
MCVEVAFFHSELVANYSTGSFSMWVSSFHWFQTISACDQFHAAAPKGEIPVSTKHFWIEVAFYTIEPAMVAWKQQWNTRKRATTPLKDVSYCNKVTLFCGLLCGHANSFMINENKYCESSLNIAPVNMVLILRWYYFHNNVPRNAFRTRYYVAVRCY